jgi:YD repeat-containing protein
LTRNDLYRGGPVPLLLQRMNFSHVFDDKIRAFGKDSWQSLDDTVWSVDPNSIQTISVRGAEFHRITPGTGFSAEAKYRAGPNAGAFRSALLRWENGGWRIDTREGEVWRYLGCGPKTPVQCYYMGQSNAAGDGIEVKRDLTTGHMQQVSQKTNPDLPAAAALDHTWTTLYDGDKITEIHDSDGRTARYRYDPAEYLTDVEADGHHIHYDYDDAHRITGVVEDDRRLRIHYDSEGRAERLDFPNGLGYRIQYSGQAIEVTGPGGRYTVTLFPTYFRTVEHK